MNLEPGWDSRVVHDELERVRADFHRLLESSNADDLAARSDGTRWTNEQVLFHMLFGYLIVWALLGLVKIFSRLPERFSRAYARILDAVTGPFDRVNYLGSCVGARVFDRRRMGPKMDRVIAALHRRLEREDPAALGRGMHYPTRWDPFFTPYMTVAAIYRYPTQHYDFHRRQLTLATSPSPSAASDSAPPGTSAP